MRNGPFVLCIAAVAALTFPAHAEAQTQAWEVSVGGGPSFPIARLGDEVGRGNHFQASLGYRTRSLPARLRVDAFYQDFDAMEREPSIHVARGGEWYRQLSANLSVVVDVPVDVGSVRPYGLVGAGWLRNWHDDITYSGERNATVSFNAGGGLNIAFLGLKTFVEARYMGLISGAALQTGPPAVHSEVDFKSIPITFGIRL